MRFFERATPKPTDPYDALLEHLDRRAEEVDELRLAKMQFGRKSHQGRYRDDPMDQEEAINVALVIALLAAVVVLLLITLQQTA